MKRAGALHRQRHASFAGARLCLAVACAVGLELGASAAHAGRERPIERAAARQQILSWGLSAMGKARAGAGIGRGVFERLGARIEKGAVVVAGNPPLSVPRDVAGLYAACAQALEPKPLSADGFRSWLDTRAHFEAGQPSRTDRKRLERLAPADRRGRIDTVVQSAFEDSPHYPGLLETVLKAEASGRSELVVQLGEGGRVRVSLEAARIAEGLALGQRQRAEAALSRLARLEATGEPRPGLRGMWSRLRRRRELSRLGLGGRVLKQIGIAKDAKLDQLLAAVADHLRGAPRESGGRYGSAGGFGALFESLGDGFGVPGGADGPGVNLTIDPDLLDVDFNFSLF